MDKVIILGATGRFGRAAVTAFRAAGWDVTELARHWPDAAPGRVTADAYDAGALTQACMGYDVIVHAIHPPYHHWAKAVPIITNNVIAAAKASNATVLIPGNVYNYGNDLPDVLTEKTPWRGNTRKGKIRIRMENAFRDSGVRTIVLRSGDFIEGSQTGNWFESHIAAKAWSGKLTYPGPLDQVHAWSYLPDMARAAAELAAIRGQFEQFEEFGFPGFALTGAELANHVETAVQKPMKVARFPWFALRVMALWSPLIREVLEMRYLWNRPHRVDGTKLRTALPDFRETPAQTAISAALAPHTPANAARAAPA